ncbi:MAG: sulfatase family protein [Gemmataceae bacterium]
MLPLLLALICAADARPRNVVLLVADDLGLTLGCYGDPVAKTPNLDALAKSGVRFSHAFAAVASCSPSRSVLYTGLYGHTSGQYGLQHAAHNFTARPGVATLPGLLTKAGYRVGIIGKVHVGPDAIYPWEVMPSNGRNGVTMAKQAAKFLADGGGKPFCLVVGYTDPHRAAKGFANEKPWPGIEPVKYDPEAVPVPDHLPDTPEVRADLADYYQAVSRLDAGVGAMLGVLKESGRDADTLVLFLSDNGIPFPGAKTTVYDAGLRLPLIVRDPSVKGGHTNAAMASWVDVLPTVLDAAKVKAPARLAGRSLLPVLGQERPAGWDEVYASHTFHEVTMYYPSRAVRTRAVKYIRNLASPLEFPFASDLFASPSWRAIRSGGLKEMGKVRVATFLRRPAEELYDVVKDPAESRNLAGDPEHGKTLEAMRAKVKAWQERTADPWAVKYEHE